MGVFQAAVNQQLEIDKNELIWHQALFKVLADSVAEDRDFLQSHGVEVRIDSERRWISLSGPAKEKPNEQARVDVQRWDDDGDLLMLCDATSNHMFDCTERHEQARQQLVSAVMKSFDFGLRW